MDWREASESFSNSTIGGPRVGRAIASCPFTVEVSEVAHVPFTSLMYKLAAVIGSLFVLIGSLGPAPSELGLEGPPRRELTDGGSLIVPSGEGYFYVDREESRLFCRIVCPKCSDEEAFETTALYISPACLLCAHGPNDMFPSCLSLACMERLAFPLCL